MERIAFIDVEGTLTDFEFWDEIANYVERGYEIRELLYKGLRGEIDWFEGFMKRVELIKGVDKRIILKASQKLKLQPQARRLVELLKSEGFYVVLVSGSFKEVIKKALTYTNANMLIANKLLFKDGKVCGVYLSFKSKGEILDRFLAERSFVLAIGDGSNDVPMFERANVSIAVGNNKKAIESANFNAKNLDDVIRIVSEVLENDEEIRKGYTLPQEGTLETP
ncbi:HAD family hydrolase [Thermococcus sp. M39]|uniref:HAD family hydrolase n=1 Tax=unclassified Thermococcus TaxID=2627626 RepID=UPI0016A80DBA|nr:MULTISPECIES: HAD family phosphatase [unclassified Thermococcus]NJE09162.1 HAD family hydrolase [Thermococcus sp. M39]